MGLKKGHRRLLLLILLGYVLLAIAYALATPPLESSDEYKHYPVVQYIQTTGRLPVLDPNSPGKWLQEGAQPPLYYLIMAGLTAWIDTGDLDDVHQVNPHAFVGNPNQVQNKNLIIHQPDREAFPWHGSILAIYVIRLATIALGIGTILITTRLGTLLFDAQVGLLAAALTAFNPMFLFVHAAVNNDALAILLGNLGLYLLVLLWRDAPDPRRRWLRYASLGVLLGLSLLTKLSLAGLLAFSGFVLLLLSLRNKDARYLLVGGGTVLATALIISVPWFVHNSQIYGDPTAMDVFIQVQGIRDNAITWQDWVGEFGTFYRSFWGLFGGVNSAAPEVLYWAYNALAIAGTAGFIYWLWKNSKSPPSQGLNPQAPASSVEKRPLALKRLVVDSGLWLLIAWAGIILVLLIRWNIISPAFQGRLLFPAISSINVLWAVGLLIWIRTSNRGKAALALSSLAFLTAIVLPLITIRPAYKYPEPLNSVPQDAQFGPITYRAGGGEIQLVGVEMAPDQSVTPGGDPVEITLYWQSIQSVDRDFLSAVNLLGRKNESVGHVNRYPARGMAPTTRWEPGQIWQDTYRLFPSDDAEAPARLAVRVALYDPQRKNDVIAYSPDGLPIDLLLVGEARLGEERQTESKPANLLEVLLADGITLQGYNLSPQPASPGEEISLTLYWQATGTPSDNYTVFVHLNDAAGNQIAGADSPPLDGDYPTQLWQAGDQVVDEHVIIIPADLPPGNYEISVGLYNPVNGARLPMLDGSGDAVRLPVNVG